MYNFELPTTGAISFSELCIDNANAYTARLSQATGVRANLRAALKDMKRTSGEKDHLRVVKTLEDYLPHLHGIMNCLAADDLTWRSDPVFSWRSTLSSNMLSTSPRLNFPGIHADLTFTLLTSAFAFCNMAASIVASLESYESERHLSEADRRAKDERLNFAVTLLCRASGLFTHIAEIILPDLYNSTASGSSAMPRVPDLNKDVITSLAQLAIADAQVLAIRKLLSKSAADSALSPGPPLPSSHPSPALIAKLYVHVSESYASARSLAKSTSSAEGDVSGALRRYLADEGVLASALVHKWLGVDAGENGRPGEAVAFLMWAKEELEDVKEGKKKLGASLGGGGNKSGSREAREGRKERAVEELDIVRVFLDTYKRENNAVHFQKVPSRAAVQALIPTGRAAVGVKPYTPPVPAFGPRTALRKSAVSSEPNEPEEVLGKYAGAGAYF